MMFHGALVLLLLDVACLQVFAAPYVQKLLTFDNCGSSGDVFTVSSIDVDPYPLEGGQDVTLQVNFDSSEEVTGGQVTASIGGLFRYKTSVDLCSHLPTPCPITQGSHSFKFQHNLPSFVPKGKYEIKLEGRSNTGNTLFCTSLEVQVSG